MVFPERIERAAAEAEAAIALALRRVDGIAEHNARRVLGAFGRQRLSAADLAGSSGYGYGDRGREALDCIYADLFGTADALVRHSFISGTHAIATALFGVLRRGDVMLSLTGAPYDTLQGIVCGDADGGFKTHGIAYRQVELLPGGGIDLAAARAGAKEARVVYLQRSRGYSARPALSSAAIGEAVRAAKEINPRAVVVVDNCYGEFCEIEEPTELGADVAAGSLIKNPGGGLAQTGGYIAGPRDLIARCADRLTVPGVGKEMGATLGENRNMLQGLFLAPEVTASAVRASIFASALFELLGFEVSPRWDEPRRDIITALSLGSPEAVCAFCRGIQRGSPVDSFVTPEPWAMPGYQDPVIMAAGTFVGGASIELSADGPLRPPYVAYLQGGLTYGSAKAGILTAAAEMLHSGIAFS